MQVGSKRFKQLQAKWYRRLEEDGFLDIEKNENGNNFHDSYFRTQYTPEQFSEKEKYHEEAKILLDKDIFLDGVEHRIWALHYIGYSIRRIVLVLRSEGFEKNKNQVNSVINEFQRMMFK